MYKRQKYDHPFKDIFQEVYDAEYKAKFEAAGITLSLIHIFSA